MQQYILFSQYNEFIPFVTAYFYTPKIIFKSDFKTLAISVAPLICIYKPYLQK